MSIQIRASYDSFRELRENGFYYVDKTEMLSEYLERHSEKAILFARPRRFGKTMSMTMFRDFLDIRQDSREIFGGLKIMDHPEIVETYMNQYPVIFLSLKEIFGSDFEETFECLQVAISTLCDEHAYLLSSDKVDEDHKEFFRELKRRKGSKVSSLQILDLLSRMLRSYHNKPAFVLIDEYDVPMAKALGTPHYDAVRQMVERMLSYVCKTNENVKAVILTGCLYTVKNSTYTGVNNIVPYTVLSPAFASAIGFTDLDVRRLLADAGLSDRYGEAEEWYDGYIFGRDRMYCPWDVMRMQARCSMAPTARPWGRKATG